MSEKVVYLMRGLPACGKSHAAKQLVAHGGVVLETDEYFYTQVGTDATQYDWSDDLLPAARAWNLARFRAALGQGVSPIVVDRGNGRNAETREYVELARQHGYDVQLKEPDSPWWLEIRELLRNRSVNRPQLDEWAVRLAKLSRATHRVPVARIRAWMEGWRVDLSVDDILRFVSPGTSTGSSAT